MPTVELARRPGVELIRTGRWDISTGQWTATSGDLAAAVAAMSCPAIQKPIVKIGHTDTRFTPGDGEPAIGWYENLRTTDGGHTLIADQVSPAWLTDVQAAAWPNRSVEGSYNYRCGLGHTHPFVLTAVALLGVTPPGVSTLTALNNLDDVRALYGLAAAADRVPGEDEVRIAASVPGAALKAAADGDQAPAHTGAMVALIPTPEDAQRLAVEGGEPVDELHVTLMYLGKADELSPKVRAEIVDAIRRATNGVPIAEAHGFAISVFNPPGDAPADGKDRDTCLVLGVSGDDLADTQRLVRSVVNEVASLNRLDLPAQHRPWVPHVTLAYTDDLSRVAELTDRTGPLRFCRVRVAFAGDHFDIPLTAVDGGNLFDLDVPGPMLPVAAAGDGKLRDYWLRGEGAAKIRWGTGGDFTRCVRHLRKHVRDPEGLCAEYHHQATGLWPGDRRNVNASEESAVPNPQPTLTERIHQAWNSSGQPEQQWIVEAAPDEVIVMDNTDRSLVRVPVTVDGDRIEFGTPQRVRTAYVPADEQVAASRMVFASAEESRPTPEPPPAPPVEQPAVTPPAPAAEPTTAPAESEPAPVNPVEPAPSEPAPNPPAAEPEPNTDPKEDPVSTLSTDVRSRLGLANDADDAAVMAALAELKTKADAAPSPDQVAAARDEMKNQIAELSGELAKIKASAAADAKKALFDGAVREGRIKPADREGWEARYERAPEVITEILASIAPNTAVPVAATGYTGADETAGIDDEYEALTAGLDGPYAAKGA
ncbi:2'-5' RNA ligase family protein [Micromonospora sp. WMMD737]|uniref:2'-5' RNA ligase family protein n=1 Tax=Micromonospora sp. WMMD737 TaxID=3404113 RepID=UPI003B9270B2